MTQPINLSPSNTAVPGWVIGVAVLSALMLVATLSYPFGYDQAVFSTGGDMVLHGAVPYRDFIDTKPPFIFYLYALALSVFGHHEWSIHAFDVLWQSGTAFYSFLILRRYFSSEVALLSASLTMILYAGSGFWMTAQAESFAILPSLLIIDMTLRASENAGRSVPYGITSGIGAAILFLLKFTVVLGAVGAVAFALTIPRPGKRTMLNFAAATVGSMLVLLALTALALWSVGAYPRFLESLDWLSNYASIGSEHFTIWESLFVVFPLRLLYSLTLTLFVFAVWSMYQWIRHRSGLIPQSPVLRLLALVFAAQILGIVLERKFEFPYQYTRALWAIVPFAAIGCLYWERVLVRFRNPPQTSYAVIFILLVGTSLVYRVFTQSLPWTFAALNHEDTAREVQHRIPNYYSEDARQAADFLDVNMSPTDQFFFWGNDVAVYFWSNRIPQTLCLTATPFRTAFTPPVWKTTLLRQLNMALPKFFVTEFGDARPESTGSDLDSYRALLAWGDLGALLTSHYKPDTTIGHFLIYRLEH